MAHLSAAFNRNAVDFSFDPSTCTVSRCVLFWYLVGRVPCAGAVSCFSRFSLVFAVDGLGRPLCGVCSRASSLVLRELDFTVGFVGVSVAGATRIRRTLPASPHSVCVCVSSIFATSSSLSGGYWACDYRLVIVCNRRSVSACSVPATLLMPIVTLWSSHVRPVWHPASSALPSTTLRRSCARSLSLCCERLRQPAQRRCEQ
jgi:hypothetical protein